MADAPEHGHEFFEEIITAFKRAGESSGSGLSRDIKVEPFLQAMTMFLRIFDAFSNPFFSDVVRKDVDGNIKKLRVAAETHQCETLDQVLEEETKEAKMLKQIKSETGAGGNSGTVALLWMKRTMQFVIGLLEILVRDKDATLSQASRKSYANSLRHCHNMLTRGVFDTGLRFAPSRSSFYSNLGGGGRVDHGLEQFLNVVQPLLKGVVDVYLERGLEKYIKA